MTILRSANCVMSFPIIFRVNVKILVLSCWNFIQRTWHYFKCQWLEKIFALNCQWTWLETKLSQGFWMHFDLFQKSLDNLNRNRIVGFRYWRWYWMLHWMFQASSKFFQEFRIPFPAIPRSVLDIFLIKKLNHV